MSGRAPLRALFSLRVDLINEDYGDLDRVAIGILHRLIVGVDQDPVVLMDELHEPVGEERRTRCRVRVVDEVLKGVCLYRKVRIFDWLVGWVPVQRVWADAERQGSPAALEPGYGG